MDARAVLVDAFGRVEETFGQVAEGLDGRLLNEPPAPGTNTVAWLLWHLARVQDDHVAELAGRDQAWEKWRDRFALPLDDHDTGYGHSPEQVAEVRVTDIALLSGYHADVQDLTMAYLERLDADELGRVVDARWDPPVTAAVRLVSVQGDCLQHLGQAAYAKGMLQRKGG